MIEQEKKMKINFVETQHTISERLLALGGQLLADDATTLVLHHWSLQESGLQIECASKISLRSSKSDSQKISNTRTEQEQH